MTIQAFHDRARKVMQGARRVTASDLVSLYGERATSDVDLLARHLCDGDPWMQALLAEVLASTPHGLDKLGEIVGRTGPQAASAEVLRLTLRSLQIAHPLAHVVGPVRSAIGAFDLRRNKNTLTFHAGDDHGLEVGQSVLLVGLQQPTDAWRICRVSSVSDDGVIILARVLEFRIKELGRQLEPAALVISVDGLAEVAERLAVDAHSEEHLLADADWGGSVIGTGRSWNVHIVPAGCSVTIDDVDGIRLSTENEQPVIVALHQNVRSQPSAEGYRFGAEWRSVSGSAMVAMRLVALTPDGGVVVDQFSATLLSGQDWVKASRAVFDHCPYPMQYEVGVLNLTRDTVIEMRSPFLTSISSLWRADQREAS
ncbi:hypothetical protein MMB232_03187 [Brevundimonas subvibrioides]|uniref:hypothetical protein n=1 Tax=Brevundimonas subvibrioides TaxID=74313 RepID=UPI0032D5853F